MGELTEPRWSWYLTHKQFWGSHTVVNGLPLAILGNWSSAWNLWYPWLGLDVLKVMLIEISACSRVTVRWYNLGWNRKIFLILPKRVRNVWVILGIKRRNPITDCVGLIKRRVHYHAVAILKTVIKAYRDTLHKALLFLNTYRVRRWQNVSLYLLMSTDSRLYRWFLWRNNLERWYSKCW